MQKKLFLSFLIGLQSAFIFSQKKVVSKKQFIADSLKIVKIKLARPQVRIDNRTIFFINQQLNISGVDAGVLLKEKLRVTLGYYTLSSSNITSVNKIIDGVNYKANYELNYGALNLEFVYKNTRFFSFGMPLEFGFGRNTFNYKSTVDDTQTETNSGIILLSYLGLSGTFKPIRSIGLKVSAGYRKTIFNQLKNLKFDGFYTSIGLAIDFNEIIKSYKMYRLKKRYHKNFNSVGTAVDLITD